MQDAVIKGVEIFALTRMRGNTRSCGSFNNPTITLFATHVDTPTKFGNHTLALITEPAVSEADAISFGILLVAFTPKRVVAFGRGKYNAPVRRSGVGKTSTKTTQLATGRWIRNFPAITVVDVVPATTLNFGNFALATTPVCKQKVGLAKVTVASAIEPTAVCVVATNFGI